MFKIVTYEGESYLAPRLAAVKDLSVMNLWSLEFVKGRRSSAHKSNSDSKDRGDRFDEDHVFEIIKRKEGRLNTPQ